MWVERQIKLSHYKVFILKSRWLIFGYSNKVEGIIAINIKTLVYQAIGILSGVSWNFLVKTPG